MALGWEWKKVFTALGVLSLCFLIIPIPIGQNNSKKAEHEFQLFLKRFNKTYDVNSTDYSKRFAYFQESLKIIQELNNKRTSNYTAWYGLTEFSDLSTDEFIQNHLQPSLHDHVKKSHNHSSHHRHHSHTKRQVPSVLPSTVDWRKKKVITPVKNQKSCGACWAFSTVEVVESMQAISKGMLKSLSVQEAIDCAMDGNLGCDGGDMCSLVNWLVTQNVSLLLDSQYPLNLNTEVCQLKRTSSGVQVASNYSCDNLVNDEKYLISLLANHGPVAVAVNAVGWQFYLGGIIQFHCSPEGLNHAVQLVGYDLTGPVPYYIARNSWGPDFGNKGYINIAYGSNVCGIATEVVSLDVL